MGFAAAASCESRIGTMYRSVFHRPDCDRIFESIHGLGLISSND